MAGISTTAEINSIRLIVQGSDPSTPTADHALLFIDANGNLCTIDSAGVISRYFPSKTGENLIPNPGLELGSGNSFTSWTVSLQSGTVAEETTIVNTGSRAVKMIAAGTTSPNIYQNIILTPTAEYEISVYTRGDGSNCHNYFYVQEQGGSARTLCTMSYGGLKGEYTRLAMRFLVPADNANNGDVRLNFRITEAIAGRTVYYDDMALIRIS